MTDPVNAEDETAPGLDPGNTDPEELTEPLDADDDVFTLVNGDSGDQLEDAPTTG